MKEMTKYRSCIILLALAMMIAATAAQTICSGFLKDPNPVQGDVVVKSGDYCTLATNVNGSVMVNPGGSLNTTNVIVINGKISVSNVSEVELGEARDPLRRAKNREFIRNISVTVRGGLEVIDTYKVFAMSDAHVGKARTYSINDFTLWGVAESVHMYGNGRVHTSGAT